MVGEAFGPACGADLLGRTPYPTNEGWARLPFDSLSFKLSPMNSTYSPAVLAPDNWAFRELEHRSPTLPEGSTSLFLEPGRVLDNVCYRAFCFRVRKPEFGDFTLSVKHGGGEESWRLEYCKRLVDALGNMDSDTRFITLHALMRAHQQSETNTTEKVNASWRQAAAEKRIKTRKMPGQNAVKVWVEPKVQPLAVD